MSVRVRLSRISRPSHNASRTNIWFPQERGVLPSLTSAFSVSRTFWPLMSRWITWCACRWAKPWAGGQRQTQTKDKKEPVEARWWHDDEVVETATLWTTDRPSIGNVSVRLFVVCAKVCMNANDCVCVYTHVCVMHPHTLRISLEMYAIQSSLSVFPFVFFTRSVIEPAPQNSITSCTHTNRIRIRTRIRILCHSTKEGTRTTHIKTASPKQNTERDEV